MKWRHIRALVAASTPGSCLPLNCGAGFSAQLLWRSVDQGRRSLQVWRIRVRHQQAKAYQRVQQPPEARRGAWSRFSLRAQNESTLLTPWFQTSLTLCVLPAQFSFETLLSVVYFTSLSCGSGLQYQQHELLQWSFHSLHTLSTIPLSPPP